MHTLAPLLGGFSTQVRKKGDAQRILLMNMVKVGVNRAIAVIPCRPRPCVLVGGSFGLVTPLFAFQRMSHAHPLAHARTQRC